MITDTVIFIIMTITLLILSVLNYYRRSILISGVNIVISIALMVLIVTSGYAGFTVLYLGFIAYNIILLLEA